MTEGEALQALKLEGGFEICGRAIRVAEFLKGLDIAEKALAKQIGVKPVRMYNRDFKGNWCSCPTCGSRLGWEQYAEKIMDHCCGCGQKLDWRNIMSDKKDKDIKNFIINYEDGTSKTVEKGFFCEMRENEDGSGNLIFNMVDVQGKELERIVTGCIYLGENLGMFKRGNGK